MPPELTGAMPPALLLQVPPEVVSVSKVVVPLQICVTPVIADGDGLTVTGFVTTHPAPGIKVTIAVPAETPVTIVVPAGPEVTVATDVLLLLQVPAPPANDCGRRSDGNNDLHRISCVAAVRNTDYKRVHAVVSDIWRVRQASRQKRAAV
jgi:hypothetical protein